MNATGIRNNGLIAGHLMPPMIVPSEFQRSIPNVVRQHFGKLFAAALETLTISVELCCL